VTAAGGAALLTGAGPAAIAILRLTGPGVQDFAARHLRWARPLPQPLPAVGRVRRATLVDADGAPLDDVLVAVHAPLPNADVRLHLHGNPVLVQRCRALAAACGLAEGAVPCASADGVVSAPGLWPVQDALAAAVAAVMPQVLTLRGVLWVLDQERRLRAVLDECVRALAAGGAAAAPAVRTRLAAIAARADAVGRFTQPLRVALVGPPNAGKSTLLNTLADQPVALVSPRPGTTRDWLEVDAELDGYPVTWIDTAGLRVTDDALEAAGVERSRRALATAAVTVAVLDGTDAATTARFIGTYPDLEPAVVALNKADLGTMAVASEDLPGKWRPVVIRISALAGHGLAELCRHVLTASRTFDPDESEPVAIGADVAAVLRSAADDENHNAISERILRLIAPSAAR